MQTSAPELIDLSGESQATLELYGADAGQADRSRTTACSPAGWSSAACGSSSSTTPTGTATAARARTSRRTSKKVCKEVDQGQRRAGEGPEAPRPARRHAGRSGAASSAARPWARTARRTGRNHHIESSHHVDGRRRREGRASSLGETDELGFAAVEDRVHVHDLHATILHLLGIEHTKLTFRFQGRDFRLTDVQGNVVHKLLA